MAGECLERRHPGPERGVRMHHDRRVRLDGGGRHRLEDPRHVADETVLLDGAFQKGGSDPRVVDSVGELGTNSSAIAGALRYPRKFGSSRNA